MELSRILRDLMKQRELSISQLASATSVASGTIKTWLRGSNPRDMADVRKVAQFFHVSLEYLFFGEDDRLPRSFEELPLERVFSGWLKVDVQRAIPVSKDDKKPNKK